MTGGGDRGGSALDRRSAHRYAAPEDRELHPKPDGHHGFVSPTHETSGHSFQTTRWSLVLATGGDHAVRRRALEDLCTLYWPPVYAYLRRAGHDSETAEDLTQGLFLDLIEREDIARASPEHGRFRTYLRACARNFAAKHHRGRQAEKRGGGSAPLSLDLADAEATLGPQPADPETPELAFERRYAQALLGAVLEQLAAEFAARGRGEHFAALSGYLEADGGPGFAASARDLGMSEGAVKVAVHRLRKRFRELLVAEVRQTLADPDGAADEIEALLAALRRPGGGFSG